MYNFDHHEAGLLSTRIKHHSGSEVLETSSEKLETCEDPVAEMKRRFRALGGPKTSGMVDQRLRDHAQKLLNSRLPKSRHISVRTAYSYWHGEATSIDSDHMDAVRALTEPEKTLDQHLSAIIQASQKVEHAERERLAEALRIIRAASLWRFLDRRRGDGVAFVGTDRRRTPDPVGSVLAEALFPSLNTEPGAPSQRSLASSAG